MGDTRRFLVVEDSTAMRGLICALLGQLPDSEVVEAENGFAALKLLPREAFDLVIMDINMPDINGLELLSFLRNNENYSETPVIIVTTEASDEDRKRGMSLGANAYLTKPFEPRDLLGAVEEVLEP